MFTIYHNPRCSKSREALSLLQQHSEHISVIEYLKTPPSEAELTSLLKKLNISARQLLRNKEDEYQQLALDNMALSEQQLVRAMSQHPKLIERPIVVHGERAVIGRPLSNVESLLS
ncbi:arsenate reductase (glutaredoxin) [Rheinheimera fenheensis]|uniref:arsenate reductase (glutaredoxin) n=1 Tax=Rheinheimera fenheensis TaxID=3152295 RepID=UPI00325F3524